VTPRLTGGQPPPPSNSSSRSLTLVGGPTTAPHHPPTTTAAGRQRRKIPVQRFRRSSMELVHRPQATAVTSSSSTPPAGRFRRRLALVPVTTAVPRPTRFYRRRTEVVPRRTEATRRRTCEADLRPITTAADPRRTAHLAARHTRRPPLQQPLQLLTTLRPTDTPPFMASPATAP